MTHEQKPESAEFRTREVSAPSLSRVAEGLERFAILTGLHMLADYPLQGDFLSRAKNRCFPIASVPWWQALGAHAVIHGLFVGLATRRLSLGVAETLVHMWTDDAKCRGRLSYNQDQAIHLTCKAVWSILATRRAETIRKGYEA